MALPNPKEAMWNSLWHLIQTKLPSSHLRSFLRNGNLMQDISSAWLDKSIMDSWSIAALEISKQDIRNPELTSDLCTECCIWACSGARQSELDLYNSTEPERSHRTEYLFSQEDIAGGVHPRDQWWLRRLCYLLLWQLLYDELSLGARSAPSCSRIPNDWSRIWLLLSTEEDGFQAPPSSQRKEFREYHKTRKLDHFWWKTKLVSPPSQPQRCFGQRYEPNKVRKLVMPQRSAEPRWSWVSCSSLDSPDSILQASR